MMPNERTLAQIRQRIAAAKNSLDSWPALERPLAEQRMNVEAGDDAVVSDDPRYRAVLDAWTTAEAALDQVLALMADPNLGDRNADPAFWSGWALADRDALLEQIDRAGVTLNHEVIVCDHVTLAYPDTAAPDPVRAAVIGVASDADIQALVVEIDGRHVRPDGNTYHVTLTRRAGVPDQASNAMLRGAFETGSVSWLRPCPIPTTPILRPIRPATNAHPT